MLLFTVFSWSQNTNWKSLSKTDKHIVSVSIGLDYGASIGVGYGYQLGTKMPIILATEVSLPFGNRRIDDFKARLGGQAMVAGYRDFMASVKAYAVFRRFENENARMFNFGSELSAVAGYYRPKYFISGEFGFDKAISTHIKHSGIMREYYPEIKNGWYVPTAGNFFYGIQSGYSFSKNDLILKAGKIIAQDFETEPVFPYYVQLGLNRRF